MAEDSPKRKDAPKGVPDTEALERQRVLGTRLKSLFEDVVSEPVPDDLLNLLDKLDDAKGTDASR